MNTIICKQLEKYKDKNGKIIGYRLVDAQGNQTQVKSDDLKNQIRTGNLKVVNLTLTQDGRLVDGAEPQIQKDPVSHLENVSGMIKTIKEMNIASLQKDDLKLLKKVLDDKLKEVNKRAYKFSAFGIDLDFEVPDFATVSKDQKTIDDYLYENKYIENSDKYVLRSVILRPDQKETNIIGMLNDGSTPEQVCWGTVQNLLICWMMKNNLYGLTPEQTEEDILNKISDKAWLIRLKRENFGMTGDIFKVKLYKK